MCGMDASPVFIHPAAAVGGCNAPASDLGEAEWNRSATAVAPANLSAARTGTDTDAKISLTAKQLKVQVDEFIKIYDGFYRVYENEVAKIRPYVDDGILQRAWSQKVEHNERYNTGRGQEHRQLSTQRKMLAACLSQIDSASRGGAMTRPPDDPSRYDRRGIYLEKIRAAGQRVLRLAELTMSSRYACEDLRSELLDLGKLVDPNGKDAKLLYRFDKRETLNSRGNSRNTDMNVDGEGQPDDQAESSRNDSQDDNTAENQNDGSNQNSSQWES